MKRLFSKVFYLLLLLTLLSCQLQEQEQGVVAATETLKNISEKDLEKGAHLFKLQCARCHGMNGSGGNAPSLKRQHLTWAPDNASLLSIIQYGIPGTEMPGTWLLSPPDVRLVAGYVRSLAKIQQAAIPGDPLSGEIIYTEKGTCALCHVINGAGGSLGPDLSRVGATRSADFIRQSLLSPGFYKKEGAMANTASGFINYLVYQITTKEGKEIKAMRVNEDAFTIQLRDAQNKFYSFRKKDIKEMKKLYETSLMPSFKQVLSENELTDLVAYLTSLQ